MVHPTATKVPEEDITSSSALDSQTHHTSPEAAAWTPSTRPQCSEEGGLHPGPPSCPISLPWPPGTSPPPRRRAGALTVSAALALPGASAPCGGTCLRSPLRPPRGFAACPPPPAHPLTRPPGRARRGWPVCLSVSPCIWEVLLLEVDFLTLVWLRDPLAGVCQGPRPSLGLRSSCPQNPPEPWGFS